MAKPLKELTITELIKFPAMANAAALENKLLILCQKCGKEHTITPEKGDDLPECPDCGVTEWLYSRPAIDILRSKGLA